MDQITHTLRLEEWQTIVANCLARPAGQSKKQWLAEHEVPEKSYYYWQSKIRRMAYGERMAGRQMPAAASAAYEFAEISLPLSVGTPAETAAPVAVIRKGELIVELNNSVSDHLLGRILEVIGHA